MSENILTRISSFFKQKPLDAERPKDSHDSPEYYPTRDRYRDIAADLTPATIQTIFQQADQTGDTVDQSLLATRIMEHDGDIATSCQTRQAALTSTPWEIVPPLHADSKEAREIAQFCDYYLRAIPGDPDRQLGDFHQLMGDLCSAILPGFALSEIVWQPGGTAIDGFHFCPQYFFSYYDSDMPQMKIDGEEKLTPLQNNKWVYHHYHFRPGDPVRGGLVRPLAYIYSFKRMTVADMIRFFEKFGSMCFL